MGDARRREPGAPGARRGLVALGLAATLAGGAASRAAEPTASACKPTVFASGRAQSVVDGRTLILTDGREVRLTGIETPPIGEGADDAGVAARAALQALVGENELALKQLRPAPDRYGRLVAHVFVGAGATEISLARALVAQGHALAAPRPGEEGCARELVAAEHAARAAKLGLWGEPRYDVKRAENPAEVLAVRGRFTLVEGKVLSVRESGATIYVNFGRRWTEDFTVTIAKRNERVFIAAGLAPQRLQGRRIFVRGFVEERGGPWIEATQPEQIEVVDGH